MYEINHVYDHIKQRANQEYVYKVHCISVHSPQLLRVGSLVCLIVMKKAELQFMSHVT